MTPSTPSTMTRTITTRAICTSEHSSALLVVFPVSLKLCHDPLGSSRSCVCHLHVMSSIDVRFSLTSPSSLSTFDLSFPVFFHSSVLMHPDLHTDLDNLDSVENILRYSAKGSLDAYDVTFSLTGYEPNDTVSNELVDSQGLFSYVTPSSDQDMDDTTLGKLLTEAHREYARLPQSGRCVCQSVVIVCRVR